MTQLANLRSRICQLIPISLQLASIGVGAPQAHIAMMNDEFVVRRG